MVSGKRKNIDFARGALIGPYELRSIFLVSQQDVDSVQRLEYFSMGHNMITTQNPLLILHVALVCVILTESYYHKTHYAIILILVPPCFAFRVSRTESLI